MELKYFGNNSCQVPHKSSFTVFKLFNQKPPSVNAKNTMYMFNVSQIIMGLVSMVTCLNNMMQPFDMAHLELYQISQSIGSFTLPK